MIRSTKLVLSALGTCALIILVGIVSAEAAPILINFETNPALPTGPAVFSEAQPQTITVPGVATISGGTVLGNETNLPAQSFATSPNVYGTADFGNGLSPAITIDINPALPVNEVSFAAFNGEPFPVSYTATAFLGTSAVDIQTELYAANSSNGYGVFDLKSTNITSVVLTPTTPSSSYDFSIDSVVLNGSVVTVVGTVPLPASAPMFGAALIALGAIGYGAKRKKAATT